MRTLTISLTLALLALGCGGDDGMTGMSLPDTGLPDTGSAADASGDASGDAGSTADATPGDGGSMMDDEALLCVEECTTNRDCFIGDMDADYECLGGRCQPNTCDENLDCVAELSASPPCPPRDIYCRMRRAPWFERTCEGDDDCLHEYRITSTRFIRRQGSCVEVGRNDDGSTRAVCAGRPNEDGVCAGARNPLSLSRPGGGMAEVCAIEDAECTRGLCRNPCANDNECLLARNGWYEQCDSDADCRGGGDTNSERKCAIFGRKQACVQPYDPPAGSSAPDCDSEAVNVELAATGSMFLACGFNVQCDDDSRVCVDRCINDRDCSGAYPVCNRDSGECECSTDAHCADGATAVVGHPVCIDGDCRCSENSHCDAFPNGDVCVDGTCGCSGVEACDEARTHDGTTYACVEPEDA